MHKFDSKSNWFKVKNLITKRFISKEARDAFLLKLLWKRVNSYCDGGVFGVTSSVLSFHDHQNQNQVRLADPGPRRMTAANQLTA